MVPLSSISITAPVSSVNWRMVAPPLPITSRIFSGSISITAKFGAWALISLRLVEITSFIAFKIWIRPACAWCRAFSIISGVMPSILISICNAVTPLAEPATLKSISPRWSSSPKMSDSTAKRSPSLTRPIAIPATGAFSGTPASINASDAPQTDAIDDEPLDSVMSDTIRITYGKRSLSGSMACTPRRARRP